MTASLLLQTCLSIMFLVIKLLKVVVLICRFDLWNKVLWKEWWYLPLYHLRKSEAVDILIVVMEAEVLTAFLSSGSFIFWVMVLSDKSSPSLLYRLEFIDVFVCIWVPDNGSIFHNWSISAMYAVLQHSHGQCCRFLLFLRKSSVELAWLSWIYLVAFFFGVYEIHSVRLLSWFVFVNNWPDLIIG